ncbi:putative membrane protein [Brucella rhizosphaerae]|uniref:Putative membrane protein n=1 Tax=Brucella rhizosphaerae TaxID=571254 RepID=A0A256FP49_9HYPH|nr:putative membrane protein [Brucella rhizosphaerae]
MFGVLLARFGFGLLVPLTTAFFPTQLDSATVGTASSDGLDSTIIITVLAQLLIVVVAAVWSSRFETRKLQIGWGCLVLGAVILLGLLATVFVSGASLQEGANLGASGRNDAATAFLFWLFVLVLPMAIGGGLLTVIGWVMISKGRRELQRG